MIEFLIRTTPDNSWPPVHRNRLREVLTPAGLACTEIEGWGDYRLKSGATEVSFSGEPGGWQISFDGPMTVEEAERMVDVIAAQVAEEVSSPVNVLQISD